MAARHKAIVALLAVAACAPAAPSPSVTREAALSSNALSSNALSSNALSSNALSSNALSSNALSSNALSSNALSSNALSSNALSSNGLTVGELSRQFLTYLYSCAMPEGATMHLVIDGADYGTYHGAVGLAPEWGEEGGHCDESCQRWVTACLLARTNYWGVPVAISLRGDHPALAAGDDESARFSLREGAYYGNLFDNGGARHLFACAGPGSNVPQITNRFCSGAQGVCDIQVRYDCLDPQPPLPRPTGVIDVPVSARFGCQRQDPSDGSLLDCWSGGVSSFGDDPAGKHFREVITVFLKEPVAICGDAVCTGGETAVTCPSDCKPGWGRSFPGEYNVALGLAPMGGGDLGIAMLASDTTDLGLGPIKILPADTALLIARLDAAGGTRWARRVATGGAGRVKIGGISTRGGLDSDGAGGLILSGFTSGSAWFDDVYLPFTVDPQADIPSGYYVASYDDAGALRWAQVAHGLLVSLAVQPDGTPAAVVITSSGRDAPPREQLIAFARADGTPTQLGPDLPLENGAKTGVFFDGDGSLIVVSDNAGLIGRYHPATGELDAFDAPADATAIVDAAPAANGDVVAVYGLQSAHGVPALARYSHDGRLLWSRALAAAVPGAEPPSSTTIGVRTDARGDIVAYGLFLAPMDFDNNVLQPVGGLADDVWVAKYDAGGTELWARQLGGGGEDVATSGFLDEDGSLLLAGGFSQTGVFDGRILQNPTGGGSPSTFDAFLVRMRDPLPK